MMQILVFFDHITLAELIPLKVRGEHEKPKNICGLSKYISIFLHFQIKMLCVLIKSGE